MKKPFLFIFLFIFALQLNAQEGPYAKRQGKAHLGQKIVHILDNSTVGAVQTTLGAGHIVMYAILNPLRGESALAKMEGHKGNDSEVTQIVIDENLPWFSGAYSLGLFQVGGWGHDHEGGHSVASAALGPLYLPTVGMSYLTEGHYNSFMESWADLEAKSAPFSLTGDTQVGVGQINWQGNIRNVAIFKFSLDQTQYMNDYGLDSHKTLSWFNTNIVAPFVDEFAGNAPPTLVEFDLLSKRLNLVVDNIAVYLSGDQELKQVIQTEQKYASLRSNPALERIHLKALDWSAKYGVIYNLNDNFSVSPKIGARAALEAFSGNEAFYNFSPSNLKGMDWTASAGLSASLDVRMFDYLTVSATGAKNWRRNGFFDESFEAKVSNEFRNPMEKFNFLHYIEVSGGYKVEKWKTPTGNYKFFGWEIALGFRF